jgi:hypothetical protein
MLGFLVAAGCGVTLSAARMVGDMLRGSCRRASAGLGRAKIRRGGSVVLEPSDEAGVHWRRCAAGNGAERCSCVEVQRCRGVEVGAGREGGGFDVCRTGRANRGLKSGSGQSRAGDVG